MLRPITPAITSAFSGSDTYVVIPTINTDLRYRRTSFFLLLLLLLKNVGSVVVVVVVVAGQTIWPISSN